MVKTVQPRVNARAIPHDPQAESALLMSVWVKSNAGMLERLDVKDFVDPWHVFLFEEFRSMWEAGEPLADGVALARWFRSKDCRGRYRAKLGEKLDLTQAMARFAQQHSEDWVTSAHDEYYFRVLRKERLRRALITLGTTIVRMAEEELREPWEVLNYNDSQVPGIWAGANETFGEEMSR